MVENFFTPGDYVQSSSKILETEKPDLAYIKLKSLLDGEKIQFKKFMMLQQSLKMLVF